MLNTFYIFNEIINSDLIIITSNDKLQKGERFKEDNNLIIYKNSDGNIIVDAIYKDEILWLTQKGMSKVFDCSIDNISLHLKNIFKDNELDENSVVEDSSVTASDGKNYKTKIYNLDAIKMDYTICMFIMNIILMSMNILKKKIKLDW